MEEYHNSPDEFESSEAIFASINNSDEWEE